MSVGRDSHLRSPAAAASCSKLVHNRIRLSPCQGDKVEDKIGDRLRPKLNCSGRSPKDCDATPRKDIRRNVPPPALSLAEGVPGPDSRRGRAHKYFSLLLLPNLLLLLDNRLPLRYYYKRNRAMAFGIALAAEASRGERCKQRALKFHKK